MLPHDENRAEFFRDLARLARKFSASTWEMLRAIRYCLGESAEGAEDQELTDAVLESVGAAILMGASGDEVTGWLRSANDDVEAAVGAGVLSMSSWWEGEEK